MKNSQQKAGSIVMWVIVALVIAAGVWYGVSKKGEVSAPVSVAGDALGVPATSTVPVTTTSTNETTIVFPNNSVLKQFDLSMSKDGFSPASIEVKKGTIVNLNITALDNTYDFMFASPKIGFDIMIKKGDTQTIGFDTSDKDAGTYTFTCDQQCGGGKPTGMLTIDQ